MKGLVRTLFVSALLLFGAATASPAAADNPPTTSGAPLYLALGDSWAFGFGGNPNPAATDPYVDGYVPQLHQALQQKPFDCLPTAEEQAADRCKQLQLLNIAEGGETTPSMIEEQFPEAIPLLETRNGNLNPRDDVELTTVHIGGNDVAIPILNACLGGFTADCVTRIQAEFAAYATDLDSALSALRGAAGDGRIVIGTYDNTFKLPTCSFSLIPGVSTLGDIVLEGDAPGVSEGLHDIMRAVGAKYEVEVADVFGKFDSQDGFDCLHPDASGYDKVTDAFLEVFGFESSG